MPARPAYGANPDWLGYCLQSSDGSVRFRLAPLVEMAVAAKSGLGLGGHLALLLSSSG